MKNNIPERYKGIIALIFLSFLWGVTSVIPRYLNISFKLFQQVYLRLFLGFILSCIFFRGSIRLDIIKKLPRHEVGLLILRSFLYYILGIVLATQALLLTKVGNVVFIQTMPMTAILGFFLLKEKLTVKKGILVFLSFIGVIVIAYKDSIMSLSFGMGEIIAFLSCIFLSLGIVLRKWHSNLLNDKEIATIMLLLASVFIFIISIFNGDGIPLTNWTSIVVIAIIIGGLVNSGISFLLNYGLHRVDAVLSNNIMALEPIFAVTLGLILFAEVPGIKEIFGGLLIIASVYFMSRPDESKNKS
jgi:drug/metabolite transporter (DMT)-like permease